MEIKQPTLEQLHENFAVVICNDNKIALQKHSQIDYRKPDLQTVLNNAANSGMTAILTGARSNNIEIMDFDLKNAKDGLDFIKTFRELIIEQLGHNFIDSLPIQRTPSGGYHWIYRTGKVEGNKKLSKGENKQAIVETRGQGGYFICAPSKGYEIIQGDMLKIPVITSSEKDILWLTAKEMEEYDEPEINRPQKKHSALSNEYKGSNDRPNYWEKFDKDCDFITMLEMDGWHIEKAKGSKYLMRRPGKSDRSWSADLDMNHAEVPLLYVYSTSTKLESEKAYSPSSYLIYWRFDGDAVKAYDYLIENGYAPERKIDTVKEMSEAPKTLSDANEVFDKYKNLKVDDKTVVEPPVPILMINDVATLHTGELLTLSGESKAGKSALLSAIISKVLNPQAQGFEIIKTMSNDYPILHFDTEQPVHRHKNNQKYHILRRARIQEFPQKLLSYNLRSTSPVDRKLMVSELVEGCKIKFGGVFMVIIDGIADFILDTNDNKQSEAITDWMLQMSSNYNCGVLCVIHLNPAPEGAYTKQRGHIGSELQRRTDSLLVIKKDITNEREESIVTAQVLRYGGIFDFGAHRIYYDKGTSMHQLVDEQGSADVSPNQENAILVERIKGMYEVKAARFLTDNGHVPSISVAKKKIDELIKYEYLCKEPDGKLMKRSDISD